MFLGARSGPRGKKLYTRTFHKKNSKENTDIILAQVSLKRAATFGRCDPSTKRMEME